MIYFVLIWIDFTVDRKLAFIVDVSYILYSLIQFLANPSSWPMRQVLICNKSLLITIQCLHIMFAAFVHVLCMALIVHCTYCILLENQNTNIIIEVLKFIIQNIFMSSFNVCCENKGNYLFVLLLIIKV